MIFFASKKHSKESKYSSKQSKHYEFSIKYQRFFLDAGFDTKFSDDSYTSRESLAPSDKFSKF
jgi:hypothetical protein